MTLKFFWDEQFKSYAKIIKQNCLILEISKTNYN